MEHATPALLIVSMMFIGLVAFKIRETQRGRAVQIRRVPGIDAIDQAIGRSVELGRPISFTFGLTTLGPTLYACLGILRHVARRAARFGTKLIVPCRDPEVLAITDVALQESYQQENRLSRYDRSNLRFLSTEQFAYASGYIGLLHRENAGSAFLFGEFAAESLVLAEAGQQIGAMQVAGTVSNEQLPFFLTTCDYTLLGEELFAAGAFLSDDPVQKGSLRAQDIAKLVLFVLIVLGTLEATVFPNAEGKGIVQRIFEADWNVGSAP